MNKKKLTHIALYVLPALAAVLNALPWCVRLQFAAGPDDIIFEFFSGYSLIPVGYGMWSHMIAGICAVILVVIGLIHARTEAPRLLKWMLSISIVGLMMSVSPLALGTATAVSTLVALTLGAEAVIVYRLREDM